MCCFLGICTWAILEPQASPDWWNSFLRLHPPTNCCWLVKAKLLTQISPLISCSCTQLSTEIDTSNLPPTQPVQNGSHLLHPKSAFSFLFRYLIEPPPASMHKVETREIILFFSYPQSQWIMNSVIISPVDIMNPPLLSNLSTIVLTLTLIIPCLHPSNQPTVLPASRFVS